jgi:hypothetical protein
VYVAIHDEDIEHALMVGYEYVILVFLDIFIPVYDLYRDKEYPTGELAPYYSRSMVGILYFEIVTEHVNDYRSDCNNNKSCPPGKEYLIQNVKWV